MSANQDLLEAAAKSAGMKIGYEPDEWFYCNAGGHERLCSAGKPVSWNPLNDDGDALRLAVKLGLVVLPYPIFDEPKHSVIVQKRYWDSDAERAREHVATLERYDGKPDVATRRAIVRAAAELGKAA